MSAVLPDGPLVAWYGDDFTGTSAVMEVLAFAGLHSAMFLEPPGPDRLAAFGPLRGIGIAGTARAETPAWMHTHLPAIFRSLKDTGAALLQYKICSTLDSSPETGSIGAAMEIAAATLGATQFPIYPASVPMRRFQAFGTLFAGGPGGISRLDRHPVMSRHPVTPMDEADVVRHLQRQTRLPLSVLTLAELHSGRAGAIMRDGLANGIAGLALDTVSAEDQLLAGDLIWGNRGDSMVCLASQGLQYALIAHWQDRGLLPVLPPPPSAGELGPIVAVSGSVSPVTVQQIEDAVARGFALVPLDAAALISGDMAAADRAVDAALDTVGRGRSTLLCTAHGPDDPAVVAFRAAFGAGGLARANRRLGETLGQILSRIIRRTGIKRAVISGGDTSGHAARQLGIHAMSALAPTVPGAALCIAHSDDPQIDGLQLALKGGQMGTPDYFDWIRQGGGNRAGV